jgi:hypothetical protein
MADHELSDYPKEEVDTLSSGVRVTNPQQPASSSDLRRRAVELLEHNLRRVETTPRRPLDPNMIRTEADQAVVNVSAAFETLNALGLVTEADRERFFRRLREITSTAYAPFKGVELQRVVRSEPARETPGLHLLAAELYRDGVLLRWLFVSPSANPERGGEGDHRPPAAFSLWDDAGTAYTPQGGGWIPGHHLRGDTAFVPAVPAAATKLDIAAGRHRFELELRAAR